MRILIYSYNYHPEPIGIAPLMTELAEGLAARGHQVRVVTAMPNYPDRSIHPDYRGRLYSTETRNGVTIQRCFVWVRPQAGLWGRLSLELSFMVLSLGPALAGWRPDVILNTSPSLLACLPVALVKRWFRCPSVLNVQDLLPAAAVKTGLLSNPWAIRAMQWLERFAYHQANRISVITSRFRDSVLQQGVPSQTVTTLPNWVDTHFICPQTQGTSRFRQRHGLQDKFVVLYAGNIAETQGISTAMGAAQALAAYPTIQLVIVGERRRLADLEHIRQHLGLTNVLLHPFVPRAELPDLVAAADVGLVLQKQQVVEFNMPSKIQLLLASGRPLVASVPGAGVAAQVVQASGGGLVVQPENPATLAAGIVQLYRDRALATRLACQGRRYAETHFSLERSLDQYEALFYALTTAQQPQAQPDSLVLCGTRRPTMPDT